MKKYIFMLSVFILLASSMPYLNGQKLKEEYQLIVKPFVDAFRNDEKSTIAALIQYPFKQMYPLKDIENETEMILRFDEIFDEELIDKIKYSSIENDWSDVGWRGIMLDKGAVWINYDGKMIKTNRLTSIQSEMWEKSVLKDRENLYSSLRDYDFPVGLYLSETYKIRVDHLKNDTFRLVLWQKDQSQSEKPELIIENGIREVQGSIGNTYYIFTDNKNYYVILYAGNAWQDKGLRFEMMKYLDSSLKGLDVYEIMEFYIMRKSEYCILDENIKQIYEIELR